MSLSYSGIVGNKGKNTLPAVESWGTDNNILRDPPKSITTRRIDKVNQDGSLNEFLYHCGDRFAENINVYARGVNPMVSVEYGNVNGGQGANATNIASLRGAPGKLPYRILDKGAFRPPILRMEQLLPLSRQPRLVTQCLTSKQFVDFSKKMLCPQQKGYREVKDSIFTVQVEPTRTMNIAQPVMEPFQVNYVINHTPLHSEAETKRIANINSLSEMSNPNDAQAFVKDVNQFSTQSALKANAQFQNYIHDELEFQRNMPLMLDTNSTKSSILKTTLQADNDLALQRNVPEWQVTAARSTKQNQADIHAHDVEISLQRNVPQHEARVNNVDKRTYISIAPDNELVFDSKSIAHSVVTDKRSTNVNMNENRDYFLPQALEKGGFEGKATIPQTDVEHHFSIGSRADDRRNMAKLVMESRMHRDTSHRGTQRSMMA